MCLLSQSQQFHLPHVLFFFTFTLMQLALPPYSYANTLIFFPFLPSLSLTGSTFSSAMLPSALLFPLPPSSFLPLPLHFFSDVCKLNYSILPRLLIFLIEPITFCMDQCRKGNDLNDCRIKLHNHSNWCKGREGGREGWKEKKRARTENGLAEGGKLIPSLTQPCMIQHVRLSASFCRLVSTWCMPRCESVQGDSLSEPSFHRDYLKCMGSVETGSVWSWTVAS